MKIWEGTTILVFLESTKDVCSLQGAWHSPNTFPSMVPSWHLAKQCKCLNNPANNILKTLLKHIFFLQLFNGTFYHILSKNGDDIQSLKQRLDHFYNRVSNYHTHKSGTRQRYSWYWHHRHYVRWSLLILSFHYQLEFALKSHWLFTLHNIFLLKSSVLKWCCFCDWLKLYMSSGSPV